MIMNWLDGESRSKSFTVISEVLSLALPATPGTEMEATAVGVFVASVAALGVKRETKHLQQSAPGDCICRWIEDA